MGISCRQFVIYDHTVEEMKNDIPRQIVIHHTVISLQDQDLAYSNSMKYSPDWKREDFCVLVRLHVWPRAAVSFHESSSSLRTDVNKAVKPVIVSCFFFVCFLCRYSSIEECQTAGENLRKRYFQCFTFKRCNKIHTKMFSRGGIWHSLIFKKLV